MSRIADAVRATTLPTEIVPIAEWGVKVQVRGMDLATRSDYIAHVVEARENDDTETIAKLDAEIIVECTFDPEDGSKAFDESDIDMLMSKSSAVIAPLSFKIQKLSGLDLGAEERLGKGFSTSVLTADLAAGSHPNGDSSSSSPENSASPSVNLSTDAAPPSAATS